MHFSVYTRFGINALSITLLILSECACKNKTGKLLKNGADIFFPGEHYHRPGQDVNVGIRKQPLGRASNLTMVPIDFIQKINSFPVADLLLNYVDDYEEDPILMNRFGEDIERSPAITPKPANCIPELQTVPLIISQDPSIVYLPSCTRIERCGGCCSHSLLSCQPSETETVSFKVVKTKFVGGNRLKFAGKEVVHMEKHTKCICGCKIQKEDCKSSQEYSPNECRCLCANKDEENKCRKDSALKLWDPESCSCLCRETTICSSGYLFNSHQCKCVLIPMRRRNAEAEKNLEGKPLEALPASDIYQTKDYDY